MKRIQALMSFASVAFCLIAPVSSHAESGTIDVLISTVSVSTSIPMGEATVTSRSGTGTITFTRSSGGPFADGASGAAQFASFSKKTATGFDLEADGLATFSADDTL